MTIVLIENQIANSKWVKWVIPESTHPSKRTLGKRPKDTHGPIADGLPQNHVGSWQSDKFLEWIE